MKDVYGERKMSHRRVFSVVFSLPLNEQPEAKTRLRIRRSFFYSVEGPELSWRVKDVSSSVT